MKVKYVSTTKGMAVRVEFDKIDKIMFSFWRDYCLKCLHDKGDISMMLELHRLYDTMKDNGLVDKRDIAQLHRCLNATYGTTLEVGKFASQLRTATANFM